MVGRAVKLHISTRRRVTNLSSGRRNLTDTCSNFTVTNIPAPVKASVGTPIIATEPSTPTRSIPRLPGRNIRGLAGIIVVAHRGGLSRFVRTVGRVNIANVAVAGMLKYKMRGNTPSCCHNIRVRVGLLPGIGVRVIMDLMPMRGIVRATGTILRANRVNSNGMFMCSVRGIIGVHANRRNCLTLRSAGWVVCRRSNGVGGERRHVSY